ncbi:AAA family ATPase [uncultured Pedobacter sp.]|uniref:AAA family ATPase n=1 Tax=uncultured Pedobacter sp. TaxID=246139 RepID=UPI00345DD5E4
MLINSLRVNNFYCYLDENVFEFSKGLNIVSGLNSGGKSQLFNAFYWTLFNKVYVDIDSSTTKKEWKDADKIIIAPEKIEYESLIGDRIECFVEIGLTNEFHENEEPKGELVDYTILKSVTYEKHKDGLYFVSKPELTISYVTGGEINYIKSTDFNWFLNRIFPSSIRKFMWFQGETVDELYDFSKPSTLNNAINEISYFPLYDNLNSIVDASVSSIEKKIDKELRSRKKLTNDQEELIQKINTTKDSIAKLQQSITTNEEKVAEITEAIYLEEQKLKGFDKYTDLKVKINKLDSDFQYAKDRIDSLVGESKEKLISKWMLNGCDKLIKASEKNLKIIQAEIQSFQKSENPVPITLPGPEYVEKMIADHICYICERPVEEGSPAYKALELRLEDFKTNQDYKILNDNYTELNRARKKLLGILPDIEQEVIDHNKEIDKSIEKRNKIYNQKKVVFAESGVTKEEDISIGSSTASQILNKVESLRNNKDRLDKYLFNNKLEINDLENKLQDLLKVKSDTIKLDGGIVEEEARDYIILFSKTIALLRQRALTTLINEIQAESNTLYNLYLGGRAQGEIIIDRGVSVIDKHTKNIMSNLNTAEIVAQKLAVANSFLSLSEKTLGRSFPMIADAPTSDLDHLNTANLTKSLGKSFEQMIIMSKDYALLSDAERQAMINDANVVKYYELTNDLIDKDGPESRINKKTYVTVIK